MGHSTVFTFVALVSSDLHMKMSKTAGYGVTDLKHGIHIQSVVTEEVVERSLLMILSDK